MTEKPMCNAAMRDELEGWSVGPGPVNRGVLRDLLNRARALPDAPPDSAAAAALDDLVSGNLICKCGHPIEDHSPVPNPEGDEPNFACDITPCRCRDGEPSWDKHEATLTAALAELAALRQQQPTDAEAEVRRILGELAGAASLCWKPKPHGVFDSTLAAHFVSQAMMELSRLRAQPQQHDPEEVREPVRWFAGEMERVLRKHDDQKGGQREWLQDSMDSLQLRVGEENEELGHSILAGESAEAVIDEAVDVANMAMMVADVARHLPPLPEEKP